MATISINPDADGDLHDASLHNDKFQTILNEINGNLDANNLANPNSFLVLTSFAGNTWDLGAVPADPFFGWGKTVTGANPVATRATQSDTSSLYPEPDSAVSECNIMLGSLFQNTTGATMTLSGGSFIHQTSVHYTNAGIILYAQRNTSVGNGWVDMATMPFNPHVAVGTANASISSFTTTPIVALPTGSFFRVLIQNNAATPLGTIPPTTLALAYASFTATFKIAHTD